MERTPLQLPEVFPFETRLEVRISDINYGGHVGNDALLALLQEARLQFLATRGWSEKDVGGCGLTMVEAVVQYRAQAFRGDVLRVAVAPGGLERIGFDLFYRVTRENDGAEIARARTAMVFFDYARQRVARMPASFRDIWQDSQRRTA